VDCSLSKRLTPSTPIRNRTRAMYILLYLGTVTFIRNVRGLRSSFSDIWISPRHRQETKLSNNISYRFFLRDVVARSNVRNLSSGYLPFFQPPTTLVSIMNRVPTPLTPTAQRRARGFFEQTGHGNLEGRKYFQNVRVRSSSLCCVTPNLIPRLRRKRRNWRCQKSFCCC